MEKIKIPKIIVEITEIKVEVPKIEVDTEELEEVEKKINENIREERLLIIAGIIGIFIKEFDTFKTALSYKEDEEEEEWNLK